MSLGDLDISASDAHVVPVEEISSNRRCTVSSNLYITLCMLSTRFIFGCCYCAVLFIFGFYYMSSVFKLNNYITSSQIDRLNTTCSFAQRDGSYKDITPIANYYTVQSNAFIAKVIYDFIMYIFISTLVFHKIFNRDRNINSKRIHIIYSLYLVFNIILLYAYRFTDPAHICKPDVPTNYDASYQRLIIYSRVSSIASIIILGIWCIILCVRNAIN